MSVKIPPMSPQATFELDGAAVKSILVEEVKRRLQPLYGDVEVDITLKVYDAKLGDREVDADIFGKVKFTVKPKVTRGEQ